MNIKQKKKQLVAAALTLALSAGTVVPALVAAPSVSAAINSQHGCIMLDTANYIMAPGNIYDIGITVKDGNGRTLSGAEVQSLYKTGKLKVTDSRTGSIANLTQLSNGNFRVTGKNPGTCYIVYEGGGNHASVKIDVKKGEKQHGTAVRNTSFFTQNIGISKPTTTTPSTTTPSTSKTYKVTFGANGGYVSTPTMTTNTSGKLSSLPTPTRSGYTFNGWYTAASGGSKVSTSTTFSKDTTLYAQWSSSTVVTPPTTTETTYKVTFNANGGSAGTSSKTTNSNGKLSSLPTATRSGYTFDGWYTSRSGGSEISTNTTFTKNTTVYAQWTKDESDTNSSTTTPSTNKTVNWDIYEDEYVKIQFIGIGKSYNKDAFKFKVQNKSDVELDIQGDTLSLNGQSLGHISGSDSIAPHSTGTAYLSTRESIDGITPKTISGQISVIDFTRTLLPKTNKITFSHNGSKGTSNSTLNGGSSGNSGSGSSGNSSSGSSSSSTPSKSINYTDPNNKYTVTIPAGFQLSKTQNDAALFINSSTSENVAVNASNETPESIGMSLSNIENTLIKVAESSGSVRKTMRQGNGVVVIARHSNGYYTAQYADSNGIYFTMQATKNQSTLETIVKSLKISYSGSSSSSGSNSGSSSTSTSKRTYTDPNNTFQVTIPAGFSGNNMFFYNSETTEELLIMTLPKTSSAPMGYSDTLLTRFLQDETAKQSDYKILSIESQGQGLVAISEKQKGSYKGEYMAIYGDRKGNLLQIQCHASDSRDSRATFDTVVNSLKILK